MFNRIFRRNQLGSLLGFAAMAMMMSAASVHSQTASPAGTASKDAATSSQSPTYSTGKSDQGATGSSGTSSSAGATAGMEKAAAISASDRNMMRELAYAHLSEIATAKLAQEKSKNDDVHKFAQRMIDDHTKALDQLQQLAKAKDVQLPAEPDTRHKAMEKKLSALSGDAFDKQYMREAGMADQRSTRRLMTHISNRAKDPELKTLAKNELPNVEQHLQMAQSIRSGKGLGATSSTGGTGATTGGAAGTSDTSGK